MSSDSSESSSDSSGGLPGPSDSLRNRLPISEAIKVTFTNAAVLKRILPIRKQMQEKEVYVRDYRLLLDFLNQLQQEKKEEKIQVADEILTINQDIREVEKVLKEVHAKYPTLETDGSSSSTSTSMPSCSKTLTDKYSDLSLSENRRPMEAVFNDVAQSYFLPRSHDLLLRKKMEISNVATTSDLNEFRENLAKFSQYSSLRCLATLKYSTDFNPTIVSCVEFNKDNEFLAAGGVTKRIKVFDYKSVMGASIDIHYPCMEMITNSKVSCVSWNSCEKSLLASSEYDGTIAIWDTSIGQRIMSFQEHTKRCWSVDFNKLEKNLLVSGSDDKRVKVYSLNGEHSLATLELDTNVCCVQFNPCSAFHLAFGCADHLVHCYDLRYMKKPVTIFRGHEKAVSYVRYLNGEEIVSASADSQLKMWNIKMPFYCMRSFIGHTNEMHFLGLATDGEYIACGSEDHALYIYYKAFSKKMFSYNFKGSTGYLAEDSSGDEKEPHTFVSAVCWKQKSNVLVAANSQGTINILELV